MKKSTVAGVSFRVGPGRTRHVHALLFATATAVVASGCGGRADSSGRTLPGPAASGNFRDCPHCPEMARIPAGTFLMGSPETETGRLEDEGPQREITVGAPFAIGVYEVTFAEWDACVGDGGCDGFRPPDGGWGRGRRPVVFVSWQDAQGYVRWLSEETGETYRLPSEAQWEYAARAGTRTARYWGESAAEQCRYANGFDQDIARANRGRVEAFQRAGVGFPSCSDGHGAETAPVGSYEPNAFGLYDVIGNLAEWTEDCWNPDHSERPGTDEVRTTGDCSRRVLRGGTWAYPLEMLRSAKRAPVALDRRDTGLSFRVARVVR